MKLVSRLFGLNGVRHILLCSIFSSSTGAFAFGSPGMSGQSGSSGFSGDKGPDASVIANGESQSQYLTGYSGSPGGDGTQGYSATNCSQPYNTASNQYGASGGSGGRGGYGGSGGNGGNIIVYYDEPQNIRNIYVNAGPGRGASGGQGSYGGRGCYCSVPSWTVNGQTYYCTNGMDGNYGGHGSTGDTGSPGQAYLIHQLTPLPATNPEITGELGTVLGQTKTISKALWNSATGADRLFRPGSVIAKDYFTFDRIISQSYLVSWGAAYPQGPYETTKVTLSFDKATPKITFDPAVWFDTTETTVNGVRNVSITDAAFTEEVRSLELSEISGEGQNLVATFKDSGNLPDSLTSEFHVNYYTRGVLFFKQRFSGAVPVSLVSRNGDTYTVRLGELPFDAGYKEAGTLIKLDISVKRRLGGNSLDLPFFARHRI